MTRFILILLSHLCFASLALSATISGEVVDNKDSITPVPSELIQVYVYDWGQRYFRYYYGLSTDGGGKFTVGVPVGSYLFTIGRSSVEYQASYPWVDYGNFYNPSNDTIYFPQTYDNLSDLNPNAVPTIITIHNVADNIKLNPIKLVKRPIYIKDTVSVSVNGGGTVDYPYFDWSSGYAPLLPDAGGNIKCTFTVTNTKGPKPLAAKLYWVAFLKRGNNPISYAGMDSAIPLVTQNVKLTPGSASNPGLTTLSCNGDKGLTIPKSFISGTHMTGNLGLEYAFRLSAYLVANGLSLTTSMDIPITHPNAGPTSTTMGAITSIPDKASVLERHSRQGMIPLIISEDGKQVLEWGKAPAN